MKRISRLIVWMIPVVAAIASCSPEFDATTAEMDVAITRVDDNQDFSAYHTFYLEDSVIYIIGENKDPADLDRTHDEQIISEVRQHFLDMGWVEVTDPEKIESDADVAILLSALAVDVYYYYTYWWDYWDWWYWDWWNPGYPGYPWYPVYPGIGYPSYGYSVGTVMIDMADLKNIQVPANEEDSPKVDIIWTGAINGILSGTDSYISERITRQINQVFDQSPYLLKSSAN